MKTMNLSLSLSLLLWKKKRWGGGETNTVKGRIFLKYITVEMNHLYTSTEKAMAPHSSTLAWKIPWMGEPGGLPCLGLHRVGRDWSDLAIAALEVTHMVYLYHFPNSNTRIDSLNNSYRMLMSRDTNTVKLRDEQLLINKDSSQDGPCSQRLLCIGRYGFRVQWFLKSSAYASTCLSSAIGLFSKVLYVLLKLGSCSPVLSRNWVKLLTRNCWRNWVLKRLGVR